MDLPDTPSYDSQDYVDHQSMDFLNQSRINLNPYGVKWPQSEKHDFVLREQIVPGYNRLVLFDLTQGYLFHTVTPNKGKLRTGFVQ